MKTKKFLSMILALAMVFSMCVSAFAEGEDKDTGNTLFEAEATVTVPAISVKVPSAKGTLFINPMGFTLKLDGSTASASEKDDDKVATSSEQVVSPVYYILNASPMYLDVTVNPLATVASGSSLTIAAAPGLTESTKNEVFIYAQFTALDDALAEKDGKLDEADPDDIKKVDYEVKDGKAPDGLVAVPSKAAKEGTTVGTVIASEKEGEYGAMTMQFFGECAGAPKAEWTNGDKLTVQVSFSFKPNMTAAADD